VAQKPAGLSKMVPLANFVTPPRNGWSGQVYDEQIEVALRLHHSCTTHRPERDHVRDRKSSHWAQVLLMPRRAM
jgi:hypothetical protein